MLEQVLDFWIKTGEWPPRRGLPPNRIFAEVSVGRWQPLVHPQQARQRAAERLRKWRPPLSSRNRLNLLRFNCVWMAFWPIAFYIDFRFRFRGTEEQLSLSSLTLRLSAAWVLKSQKWFEIAIHCKVVGLPKNEAQGFLSVSRIFSSLRSPQFWLKSVKLSC